MSADAELSKLAALGEHKPELLKAFADLDAAVMGGDGAISLKNKELIALAVALTTQCEYCLKIHAEKARKAGASEEELTEVTFIAASLRAGAAVTHGANYLVKGQGG